MAQSRVTIPVHRQSPAVTQQDSDEVFQPPATAKKTTKPRVAAELPTDKPVTTMKNVNIAKLASFLAKEFETERGNPDKARITAALYDFIESTKPSKGEIILVLGYSEKSNGIFGDTEPIKEQLASLNVGKLKVTTPNHNLAFGSGFVSSSKYIDRIRELLATLDVNVREVQRSDYEVEYEGGEKALGAQVERAKPKRVVPVSTPVPVSAPKKTIPTKKASGLKPPPPRPAAKKISAK